MVPRFCGFKGEIKCDPNFPYRQLNGSCNNLDGARLWWGKAEMPYKRYLPTDYGDCMIIIYVFNLSLLYLNCWCDVNKFNFRIVKG
jgi:hypothetical protein